MKKKYLTITITIFVLLSALFYQMSIQLPAYHFVALEVGNIIMAILTISSFFIVNKQVDNRPQAFVRGVYSASFLKLMVCMVSVLVYVLINRAHIHKPSVFVLFGIYIIYTTMETLLLSKLVRK